jgi:hypothetical protein
MKSLGIAALLSLVLSLILWFINWSYWFYEMHVRDAADYSSGNALRNIMQGVSTVSVLTEYLAIFLVAVGLIIGAKRLPKD